MKYVLITGATSGIGYALAEIFVREGYSLILVGRSDEKLKTSKEKLMLLAGKEKSQSIQLVKADLSKEGAAKFVYEQTKEQGLEVGTLINNAGVGYAGEFIDATDDKILELITVNMTNLTLLTKYYALDMKEDRHGSILNVASTGSYHPGTFIAEYYATKAYVLSLSEALYEELKPYGIIVSSLCPGATLTGFAKASGRQDTKMAMSADFVARKAYEGLVKGRKIIVPGLRNKLMIKVPKKIAIKLIKSYQKKMMIS